jgi:hypothetical protein
MGLENALKRGAWKAVLLWTNPGDAEWVPNTCGPDPVGGFPASRVSGTEKLMTVGGAAVHLLACCASAVLAIPSCMAASGFRFAGSYEVTL